MYKFFALILLLVTNEVMACSSQKAEPSEYFVQATNINYGRVVGLEIRIDDGSCRGNSHMLGYHYVIFTTEDYCTTGVCGGTEVILPQMSFSQDFLNKLREISPNKVIKSDS